MIVTLAGHVDHGKTSLVRALTGVDTDRLAEEKARGLTIDLGFAYIKEDDLGFVDVPGHHRFIHNMVAGVAAHQFALLVVAADDGPMPQTVEHLQILSLLGLKDGIIALTKCDIATPEQQATAITAIEKMVTGTFLEDSELFRCAATDPDSIAPVREHLSTVAIVEDKHTDTSRNFRMPVDRAFNIKGSGTVVTGTVLAGQIAVDTPVKIFPGNINGRVRSIRVSDMNTGTASVGERTALNLAGVSLDTVQRGSWVTVQAAPSSTLAVSLEVLADFPRPVRHWTPVHVYHGTSHTTARMALLDNDTLQPGGTGLVDLVCDDPLPACSGDRLLIRDHGLDQTLGGGTVIDTSPPIGRRRGNARQERLAALNTNDVIQAFTSLLAIEPVHWPTFRYLWGLPDVLEVPATAHVTIQLGDHVIRAALWEDWLSTALSCVEERLAASPNLQGLRENEFPELIPGKFRADVLRELVSADKLAHTAGMYHLPRHEAQLTDAQSTLMGKLETLLNNSQPPSVGDIAKQTNQPLHQLTRSLQELAKLKVLDRINDNRYYLPTVLDQLAETTAQLGAGGHFNVKQFRDTTGIGRNVAIDVLEHFDRKGFTRRQGNERIVVGTWRSR